MSHAGRVQFVEVAAAPSDVHPDHLLEKTYRVDVDGVPVGLVLGRYFSHWDRSETFPRFWIPMDFNGNVIKSIYGYSETRRDCALGLIREKLGEDVWAGLRDL